VARLGSESGRHVVVGIVKLGGIGCCLTVMVALMVVPAMRTVTEPVRSCNPVLAVALSVNEPFPVRLAGFTLVKVSHESFDVIAQALLDPICTAADEPPASGDQAVRDVLTNGAPC